MARVMVCDDNADILLMMAAVLAGAGHQVTRCASGRETLERLGIEPPDASVALPDLLVLDIMTPQSDGQTVGTAIRNTPHTSALPILVSSALREAHRVFRVPVDGFLSKPFTAEDLIGRVAGILSRRPVQ